MNRRTSLTTIAIMLASAALLPGASPADPVNKDRNGFAVRGHDPVAYFQYGKPVKGSPAWTHQWNGATWLFASPESRELFKVNPEKYAPQYGGYCAWAVSNNYTADADPDAWKIVNGRLYLNYNKSVQQKWEPEASKRIVDADRNWPGLHK
jgi:YHS domain-containing protein